MDQGLVLELARQGISAGLMVALPMLLVGLVIGIVVSIFQAVTQVQEATLTFVPKLLAMILMLLFLGNWMLTTLVSFLRLCLEHMGRLGQ
jgi:flagellar biosynthetic protein FliQ